MLTPGLQPGFADSTFPLPGNSVDGDDGHVDGVDLGGHSISAFPRDACAGPSCTVNTQWNFNDVPFGKYPTAYGIVITASSGAAGKISVDGFGSSPFQYEGIEIDIEEIVSNAYDATDDWFIGVTNPFGIYSVNFIQLRRPISGATSSNPSFDHLQYGLYVPEPSGLHLLASFGILVMYRFCYRRNFA